MSMIHNKFFNGSNIVHINSPFFGNFVKSEVTEVTSNQNVDSLRLYSDRNKTYFYESICGIASYFCTSDIHNNFTIRRQPTYYYDAVEKCKTENSSLISSKSASDIALAKDGFKIGFSGSPSKNPDIKTPLVAKTE